MRSALEYSEAHPVHTSLTQEEASGFHH